MNKPFDILVAGELNPDLILAAPDLAVRFGQHEGLVDAATMTIGSSAAIFACGAARLGLKVVFIGVVGDDLFGRFMLESLTARNVDVSNVIVNPALDTGLSVILSRGVDRAILTHLGAMDTLCADDIPDELLKQARHFHVTSYFLQTALQPDLPALFARARGLGLTTSIDTNWDPDGHWTGVDSVLEETTIFLPNDAEALALTGADTVEDAARRLATKAGRVAVKLGGDGALACDGGEIMHAAAIPADVVDTVGAGDTFDAGFVYGYLHGWNASVSLHLGIACGSLSTREAGGTSAQPTLAEAQSALENQASRSIPGLGQNE